MKQYIKLVLKGLVPPVLIAAGKVLLGRRHPSSVVQETVKPLLDHHGDFERWEDALVAAGGYDAQNILDIQHAAMRKVRDGHAVYERDSVIFDEITLFYPMLSALLYVATRQSGGLRVLDFGGALGSSYYQNRELLSHLKPLQWRVVEQPHFVIVGQSEFRNGQLDFYPTLDAAWAEGEPDVVLLSSVLQYLPDPIGLLGEIIARGPRFILIDRTPVLDEGPECIMVQTVPPDIYPASYACRMMPVDVISSAFEGKYDLRFAFDASVGGAIPIRGTHAHHRGYFYERRY